MAFSVSALVDYVKETADQQITRSYFDSKTYDYLTGKGANTQTGIKSSEKILLLSEDVIFQNDTACSFDASGSTTYSNRTITPGAMKVNKTYCPKDLRAKYTQVLLKQGSQKEVDIDQAWAKAVTDAVILGISEGMEKQWWQGDTTVTDQNLNKFDGIVKQTLSGSVEANTVANMGTAITTGTGFTTTNIRAAVQAMWLSLPEKLKGKSDIVIAMGTDLFDLYTAALVTANLYAYNPGQDGTGYELKVPGTSYTITGFPGLSGSNTMRAFRASNVYFGVDLEHEEEQFDMWESKDDQNVKLKASWKTGVNVAYPSEVVKFTLV